MQETVETTTVSRRLSNELVVECRSRSTSAFTELSFSMKVSVCGT